jgi:peptidoglycan lytic transglycosylase
LAASIRIFAIAYVPISTKPERNTIAGSARSSTTPWTTSITGWCRYSLKETRQPWANTHTVRLSPAPSLISTAVLKTAARLALAGAVLCSVGSSALFAGKRTAKQTRRSTATSPARSAVSPTKPSHKTSRSDEYLEHLSRTLKDKDSSWAYARLSAFATHKSSGVLGARAALALGYYDYSKGDYAKAAPWFERSLKDTLLREYALYWSAENDLALNRNADALAGLKQLRTDYPNSVITDQTLQALGTAALAAKQPMDAVTALNGYPATTNSPALLLLRGEAYEQAGQIQQAAADYQSLYLRYPTGDQGREASVKLSFLTSAPGNQLPPISLDQQEAHAAALFGAGDWSEARDEYSRILPQLMGVDKQRAQLRILECGASLGAGPTELAALQITDPDVDAERFYALVGVYRSIQDDAEMAAAVEGAASRAPQSLWTERALMGAGNQFWVELDRDKAASYYKRLEENFPDAADAVPAQWRVAWVAVLKRQPDALQLLTEHVRRYPNSPFIPDALYWLGRLSEEAGNSAVARSYYDKLVERFPENYFETAAEKRLPALGNGTEGDPEVLALIPPAPAIPKLSDSIPAAAADWQGRADALRSIAFDSSAELELRAAYAATGEPRLLFEAAKAAVAAVHVGAAIVAVRQIYPQLESHAFDAIPLDVWKTAYALPYRSEIHQWSERAGVDPLLVAGLIRQESAFEKEAHSNKNARGLMQLEPTTAYRLAHHARIRYSRVRLFEPDYNVRLGTLYLAELYKQFGNMESVLAAYNAGEDRVTAWTAGQTYREPAEFVDSIPFTQTRDYVEMVSRNADIYRRLYGATHESRRTTRRRHNKR